MQYNRALIVPLVSLLFLVLKDAFNFRFDDSTVDLVSEAVCSLLLLGGVFMHPKKSKDDQDEQA